MFELPEKIAALMRGFESNWLVAGGWAIDLYLGEITRAHDDIEIAVFRRDQIALQNYLSDWFLQKVENRMLSRWQQNEFLELPVHEIHCFRETSEPNKIEVLLNEKNVDDWVYRRNDKITRSLERLRSATRSGINFLPPEIVLLYKSKNPRAKDEQDFQAVRKALDIESRAWLKNALSNCYREHPWLDEL